MKNLLNEEDAPINKEHAAALLQLQVNYNKALQDLNNKFAKQKSDLSIKFMNVPAQKTAVQQPAQTTTQQQTGTVNTAGTPMNADGSPATKESYPDILRIKELNELDEPWLLRPGSEEIRYTGNMNPKSATNWYERPVTGGHPEKIKREPKKKDWTWKIRMQIMDFESDIQQLEDDIRHIKEKFESPEGSVKGEVEEFFAEIGLEASEILNSGAYKTEEEKLRALQQVGIANAKSVLQDYYYYYPEFNPALDKERKGAKKEISKIQTKIDRLQAKIDKIESMYESINENSFLIKNVDPYELQDLKDYLDAENISYAEDEDGETIDFDETELDQEWQDRMDDMGFEDDTLETETDDILSMDDEEDFADIDKKIDEEKVFYVRVDDEAEQFIGKIYKLFDEGDWRAKLISGESETFEKLNYDPDFDSIDIIAFLRENYADAELMSEEEFNDHVENPEAELEEVKDSDVFEGYLSVGNPIKVTYPGHKDVDKIGVIKDRDGDFLTIDMGTHEIKINAGSIVDLGINESVNESVQNASDFKRRLQKGDWKFNKKEFEELKQFVEDMDKRYGKDEHSWGKYSESAIKHPKFYKKINENLHTIPTFDQYLNEITFSDNMEFNTSGELHTEERNDGWYVVGKNMLIPVKSEEEGNEYIKKLENN